MNPMPWIFAVLGVIFVSYVLYEGIRDYLATQRFLNSERERKSGNPTPGEATLLRCAKCGSSLVTGSSWELESQGGEQRCICRDCHLFVEEKR